MTMCHTKKNEKIINILTILSLPLRGSWRGLIPSVEYMTYAYGENKVEMVILNGEVV